MSNGGSYSIDSFRYALKPSNRNVSARIKPISPGYPMTKISFLRDAREIICGDLKDWDLIFICSLVFDYWYFKRHFLLFYACVLEMQLIDYQRG